MPLFRLCQSRALIAVLAALVTVPAGAAAPLQPPAAGSPAAASPTVAASAAPPGFAALAARLLPAVVNIAATTGPAGRPPPGASGGSTAFARRFRDFMDNPHPDTPAPRGTQSLGSGFIIDPAGLIVTNDHVIGKARRIMVTLQDGTALPAQVVGRDRDGDLALLRVDAGHALPFVRWGDSDTARVGDWVVAIGNPFGLGGTVTAGIVSARQRNIHDGPYDDFIQTDAPINRGNSGGPLFDFAGRVIGVNSAIYSPSGGSVGIAFAIPSDMARTEIAQLRRYGHPARNWLGLQGDPVTADMARSLGLPGPGGVLVAVVTPDGPAATAGVQPGDVILRFADTTLHADSLPRLVAEAAPGSGIPLLVWRDGRQVALSAQLGTVPAAHPAAAGAASSRQAMPAARAARLPAPPARGAH